MIFDQAARKAAGTMDGNTETLELLQGSQDTLSVVYFVRPLPYLNVGSSTFGDVLHDKKNYRV